MAACLDRPVDGLVEVENALALARTLGHAEAVSYAQWHRSEILAALGRVKEAGRAAGKALAIASKLGHRGWTSTALLALGTAEMARGGSQPLRTPSRKRSRRPTACPCSRRGRRRGSV